MLHLAPTLHYDSQLIVEMRDKLESYRTLHTRVLLAAAKARPI